MALTHTAGFSPTLLDSPWMWPLAAQLARFRQHERFPDLSELAALLAESAALAGEPPLLPMRAIKSKRKGRRGPIQVADLYDVRIAERSELPTRLADWHDFFNVLSFAAWPRAKRALHRRQARLLRERLGERVERLPGARTREQDALTLFDEGGVVLLTTQAARIDLDDAQLDLDTLVRERLAQGLIRVVPFGHALFEHLVAGLRPPLAFPCEIVLEHAPADEAALLVQLDERLARQLADPAAFREPTGVRGLSLLALETALGGARRNLVRTDAGG